MSYEIVKGIKINEEEKKVYFKSSSNNVYPKDYEYQEFSYFSNLLKEKGIKEVEIAILKEYESGNLQKGTENRYTRALKVLYYVYGEEYKKFNWRVLECEDRRKIEDSEEFKALLLKALNTKLPKNKFIVVKNQYDKPYYVRKTTSRHIFYGDKEQAKIFDFREIAERVSKQLNNSEVIQI
jgi:hypothetical protein